MGENRGQSPYFALFMLALLLGGCAYVGEPLPPALNIPRKVTDLRAVQRGALMAIEFSIPETTTEDLPIKQLSGVALRVGRWGGGNFDFSAWEAASQPIPVSRNTPGATTVEVPIGSWAGSEVFLAVRLQGRKGRFSDWSQVLPFHVVAEPQPPKSLVAQAVPEGVRLRWSGPAGASFQVYRDGQLLGAASGPEFVDSTAETGKSYSYGVRTAVRTGDSEAFSAPSGDVKITPRDTFPPARPVGVTLLAAAGSVELSWDRNMETDFRGYRVYRALGNAPWRVLDVFLELPAYSDREVEDGATYRYAVAAVDRSGNESERSELVSVTALR